MDDATANDYDDRTIGRRLKNIRRSRKKSLRVVAGLAGISAGHLSRIENGERALDCRSLTVALANALQVSPSELTSLPVPAPADGTSDSSIYAVRRALMAVNTGRPGGQVQPVEQLRHRAGKVEHVDYDRRGEILPDLIADLHTTMTTGNDMAELLRLAVMLHAQTVRGFFYVVGAPLDLRWQATVLAGQAAEELNESTMFGVVAWATVIETLATGTFDLARDELDSTAVPTDTSEGLQLDGMLALSRSLVAAADNTRPRSPRRWSTPPRWPRGPGRVTPSGWASARSTWVSGGWRPPWSPASPTRRSASPSKCGPASTTAANDRPPTGGWTTAAPLARVRRRDDAAMRALRRGEQLFPMRVLRNPYVRDVLAELTARSKDDAVGRELRGMAYRAGLPG